MFITCFYIKYGYYINILVGHYVIIYHVVVSLIYILTLFFTVNDLK